MSEPDLTPRLLCTNLDCPFRLRCARAWPGDGCHKRIRFEFTMGADGRPVCWSLVAFVSVGRSEHAA